MLKYSYKSKSYRWTDDIRERSQNESRMLSGFDPWWYLGPSNTEWHYALDITEDTDEAKYMSLKTLWNFRKKVIDTELDREIFNEGTGANSEDSLFFLCSDV
jgi:hypothetical protein